MFGKSVAKYESSERDKRDIPGSWKCIFNRVNAIIKKLHFHSHSIVPIDKGFQEVEISHLSWQFF